MIQNGPSVCPSTGPTGTLHVRGSGGDPGKVQGSDPANVDVPDVVGLGFSP